MESIMDLVSSDSKLRQLDGKDFIYWPGLDFIAFESEKESVIVASKYGLKKYGKNVWENLITLADTDVYTALEFISDGSDGTVYRYTTESSFGDLAIKSIDEIHNRPAFLTYVNQTIMAYSVIKRNGYNILPILGFYVGKNSYMVTQYQSFPIAGDIVAQDPEFLPNPPEIHEVRHAEVFLQIIEEFFHGNKDVFLESLHMQVNQLVKKISRLRYKDWILYDTHVKDVFVTGYENGRFQFLLIPDTQLIKR